jgi:hypothetical protein
MSELKDRMGNEVFVTAFTADQSGALVRFVCAALNSVLELPLFRSRRVNGAKQTSGTKYAAGYANDVNFTSPAPSAV